jgi:hypothetical protein
MKPNPASRLEQINSNLNSLVQMDLDADRRESETIKVIRHAKRLAECYRSISRFFEEDACHSLSSDLRIAFDIEAKHFRERANLEERSAANREKFIYRDRELKNRRAGIFADLLALRDKASTATPTESNN